MLKALFNILIFIANTVIKSPAAQLAVPPPNHSFQKKQSENLGATDKNVTPPWQDPEGEQSNTIFFFIKHAISCRCRVLTPNKRKE